MVDDMTRALTKQKVVSVGVLLIVGVGAIAALRGRNGPAERTEPMDRMDRMDQTEQTRALAKDPRQVLGRPWFDRYPKNRNTEMDLWWFSSAGIGIHERGSYWRSTMDFFDFERASSRLEMRFLQDKKKESVSFEIVACDDTPPFDLCLDVKEPLRGKKRFYSFAFDDDMESHVPWAKEWRASAEARSRGVRGAGAAP